MGYRKIETDGYILGIVKTSIDGNLSEEEYTELSQVIHNSPTPPDGYCYRLKTDLTWELCEIPTASADTDELTDTEALAIILGGDNT